MKKCIKNYCLIKIVFMEKIAYLQAVWCDIIATLISVCLYYYLWKFVFINQSSIGGYSFSEMTTYIIVSRILSSQFSEGIDRYFSVWIYEGNIGVEMNKPIEIFSILAMRRFGEFFFWLLAKAFPVYCVCIMILRGHAPSNIGMIFFFFISIILSLCIMFYIEMIVGICSFYTLTHYALGFTKTAVLDLLSGAIIPFSIFPEPIYDFLNVLPFAGMVSIPINIFLGKYEIKQILVYMLIQFSWVLTVYFLAHIFYNHAIKKIVVQGG